METTTTTSKRILSGHYSAETAYVVADYPYGFRLRCQMRYWLEVSKKGTRLWQQSSNPKARVAPGEDGAVTLAWNKPKASTYCDAGAMYLDVRPDKDGRVTSHVHWAGLSKYDAAKASSFMVEYEAGLTPGELKLCKVIAAVHLRYLQAKSEGRVSVSITSQTFDSNLQAQDDAKTETTVCTLTDAERAQLAREEHVSLAGDE